MQDLRSQPEKDFYAALEERKVKLEGFITRNHREWALATYTFRFQKGGKWSSAHYLPWDGKTYAAALAIIDGKGK